MNAALIALLTVGSFVLSYFLYSRFLSEKIFQLEDSETVPSKLHADGVDFVATKRSILWGHHFTSIAGAAPIVGPAIAVIWGWLPALIWIVLGTIFMGAVHDFSAMVISLRNQGRSIGDITGEIIGPRARTIFLLIISLLIWIVLAVFSYVIATLFVGNPSAIFPINIQILVALILGWATYKRKIGLGIPSLIGYSVLLVGILYGDFFAKSFPQITQIPVITWVWILLLYSFVSSVLPVWLLLQPRDYLNSHQLLTGLGLLITGLLILQPTIVAPAVNPAPPGAPPMIPFLFITIACGAISGFHGLVSSGTTSKQINRMTDARPIGYGSMLGEGTLGMLAVLAATAGFASLDHWSAHYSSWGEANGLAQKLEAFVSGSSQFISAIGIAEDTSRTFVAVMVIAFAATSLDTGARIQRLIISELATNYKLPALKNRFVAAAVGIGAALVLAITQGSGKGGLILWPLFGTTNQLVAGATLLVVSLWLKSSGKPILFTLLPAIVVTLTTCLAMTRELLGYLSHLPEQWLLAFLAGSILTANFWLLFEGSCLLLKRNTTR